MGGWIHSARAGACSHEKGESEYLLEDNPRPGDQRPAGQ
jgi:hypothetical protein